MTNLDMIYISVMSFILGYLTGQYLAKPNVQVNIVGENNKFDT